MIDYPFPLGPGRQSFCWHSFGVTVPGRGGLGAIEKPPAAGLACNLNLRTSQPTPLPIDQSYDRRSLNHRP